MEVMQDSADADSFTIADHNPDGAVLDALEFLPKYCWYFHGEGVTFILSSRDVITA